MSNIRTNIFVTAAMAVSGVCMGQLEVPVESLPEVEGGHRTGTVALGGAGSFCLVTPDGKTLRPQYDTDLRGAHTEWTPAEDRGWLEVGTGDNVISAIDMSQADLWLDKACYKPGDTARISFGAYASYPGAKVRYRHLSERVLEHDLTAGEWTWTVPGEDFKGYMVDVYVPQEDGSELIVATTGVDVSSDWTRFPRYGYTAWYEPGKERYVPGDVAFLNRRHINAVQFQDWHWRHHRPYNSAETYTDISNREISLSVVRSFIDDMHGYGMKTFFYDLCYGALGQDGAAEDGVREEWYMFTGPGHENKDSHPLLDINWKSNIDLLNPADTGWQEYFGGRVGEVYDNLAFDGFQVDQLGYRGDHYDYWGNRIYEWQGYGPFLKYFKNRFPEKRLVMNAVSDYGGNEITRSGVVDACYTEMWGGESLFHDLYRNVADNNVRDSNGPVTVFAAYMNYDYGKENPGKTFNTPGILMADACMFALGAGHLELGTGGNMLCNEYFPNTNLKIGDGLRDRITHYYDFATAYENLLYGCVMNGGRLECDARVRSRSHRLSMWSKERGPQARTVTVLARETGEGKRVLHLLNFMNTASLSWRDLNGDQKAPAVQKDIELTIDSDSRVGKVWMASPDQNGGVPQALPYRQTGRTVTVTVPALEYWTMLVME